MTDFLLELRSEEIPARMQGKARDDLARLFAAELDKAGLSAGAIVTFATPRRLALIARDLPLETEATSEERKGPRADAPAQALDGFLRSAGLTRDQLEERDDGKGNKVLFAVTQKPGRATADVLAEAIPAIIRAFPWPKSMRWGAASASTESLRWVRPLQGIIALLGSDVVPFEIAGIVSGSATVGHRFHHPGIITIGSASDYAEKLRACHVIIDQDERKSIIALGATMAASKAGLTLVRDEGLLVENAGLTEWPMPLLGRFDAAYLSVPPEVIQLTARVNQKYFVCQDADGKLANAFVCTANIDAVDGGAKIVEGNRKVLAARLSDAKFFWEQDLKVPLEEQAKKLDRIGLSGIDTRALTRRIRSGGAPNGVISHRADGVFDIPLLLGMAPAWPGLEGMDLAISVTTQTHYGWEGGVWRLGFGYDSSSSPLPLAGGAGGGFPASSSGTVDGEREPTPSPSRRREGDKKPHVVAIDYGAKHNIYRNLVKAGAKVSVLPATATFDQVMALKPDGIFLSNGPGDPAATGEYAVPVIRQLLETRIPLFGICLGHQLLGLAVGAETTKMFQGHRGANHPVKRLSDGAVEITSMNHGFAVVSSTLPETARETHVSLFDGSNAGFELTDRPAFSVQYHPEASPGPQDSFYLFEKFVGSLEAL